MAAGARMPIGRHHTTITLTRVQENRIRVTLFKARYKSLANEGLSVEERFMRAIAETSEDNIKLEYHSEIIEKWLKKFEYKYARKKNAASNDAK